MFLLKQTFVIFFIKMFSIHHSLIDPSLWPPNSPDLNPVDYCIRGILQERVYRDKIANVTKLKKKIRRAWEALDGDIVINAISQWRRRLRACVHAPAGGGHFEQ